MKMTEKGFSRRKMMLITGGAVAGASALIAAPFRRNIRQVARRVVASTDLGRAMLNLAQGTYQEWLNEVGATFSISANRNMQLVGVRALPTSGAKPDNVRQQGFVALFDPVDSQSIPANALYSIYHSSYGAMLLYLARSTDPATPRRVIAVFN